MDGFTKIMLALLLGFLSGCASSSSDSGDPLMDSADGVSESALEQESLDSDSLFEDLDQVAEQEVPETSPAPAPSPEPEAPLVEEPPPVLADDDFFSEPPQASTAEPAPVDTSIPQAEAPPAPELPVPTETRSVTLRSINYKASENGGTIIIDADGPMNYTTRMNRSTNQFIIEIADSVLPTKLMRPLNTKDFEGAIGAIDAYQPAGSRTARIVVQMRGDFEPPTVQAEGNALLVIPNAPVGKSKIASSVAGSRIFSSDSLQEFLSNNSQFTGKKITIETDDLELKDIFKFISEEVGINLVIADEVRGRMTLKLREVPWDQALVLILKTKKLGYTRSGNVLRIAPMNDIRQEEDDSVKIANAIKATAPLKVRLLPISYASPTDLAAQVKPFLSPRGTVTPDVRTASLIVSDIEENIERIKKLVTSIDVPPTQVLIEGKIVEASSNFERRIGVNWGFGGQQVNLGSQNLLASTNTSVTGGATSMYTSINFGTLDVLGTINAQLLLFEREGAVKVLSSPRIVTLHNEPAQIAQTVGIPVVTAAAAAPGQAVVPTVQYKDVKLELKVTPSVTNDGSVAMKIDFTRDIPTEADSQGNRAIQGRSANTKVLVRNGQTAVIGGIFQNNTTESETRVPVLGDLPVVGWLFKGKNRDENRNELMIFLTPRILAHLDGRTGDAQGAIR